MAENFNQLSEEAKPELRSAQEDSLRKSPRTERGSTVPQDTSDSDWLREEQDLSTETYDVARKIPAYGTG